MWSLSFAKTSAAGQVVDLSALILTQSRLNGHSPAPPAPAAPVLLRRPPTSSRSRTLPCVSNSPCTNVTEHPTAHWTAQQIVDAFPDDSAPPYLLRDRDQVYGQQFRHRVKGMRIAEVLTAPHSPGRILWPSASSVRSGASV